MQKQRRAIREPGYATDFVQDVERILPEMRGEGHQDHRQRGRREPARRCGDAAAAVVRKLGVRECASASSKATTSSTASTSSRPRARASRTSTRASRSARGAAMCRARTCTSARNPIVEALGRRRRHRDHRPVHGRRRRVGAADPRVRLGRRRLRQAVARRSSPVTSSSAARSAPAATSPGGAPCPTSRTSAIPIAEARADGTFVDHQARRHRRARQRDTVRAAALRDRRPARVPHARRDRRFHQCRAAPRTGRTACRSTGRAGSRRRTRTRSR